MKTPLLLTAFVLLFQSQTYGDDIKGYSNDNIANDTTSVEMHFSKKQLETDVNYLNTILGRVHPNQYHSINKQKYEVLKDSVTATFKDGMTRNQVWPAMARLIGALNEGHSYFNYPDGIVDQLKKGTNNLFPVVIQEFDGQHLVVRSDVSVEDQLKTGDLITSINGIEVKRLINLLTGHTGGLIQNRAVDVCRNLITYLNLYNIHGPYQITYLRDGESANVTLNAISWAVLKTNKTIKDKTLPKTAQVEDYTFTYPNNESAILSINSLTAEPAVFKQFLDSCFTVIQHQPVKRLIIDLRRNGGGNSALGNMLLGYITDKPFSMSGGMKWKVSQEYKNVLKEHLKAEELKHVAFYMHAVNGTLLEKNNFKAVKPANNKLLYQGKVMVLIGPRTFSSANMLANTIQDYKLATLIGEDSGEPANDYGEVIFLKLPNTGFTFTTSTKQFIRANGDSKDPNPVKPDYVVKDDLATPADEVLDFAKSK